eukprot:TRINITY_DN2529_c0_g2_i1.p1 TRINITY_DN2529_c0_g2~~TRINITY_DN2529_c0_g2_i1.p1  ORF type:complete len:253 (-),score=89.05 TRINITY_DN2529_c0_g2_i1:241-999(-)
MVVKILTASEKKYGALFLVCALFEAFLKLKNVTMCNSLLPMLQTTNLPPVEEFSVSQRVMYSFYRGRLAIFESKFVDAVGFLQTAFELCTKKSLKNKRLILCLLVPAKILVGSMPSDRVLDKYGLYPYKELCEATRVGNVSAFQRCLRTHRAAFVRLGIYLTLERIQVLVYRNLFRSAAAICGSNKVRLQTMRAAVGAAGLQLDGLEVECILATLIYRRLIKGYLHHERQVLVLSSKADPFPPLHLVLGPSE